MDLVSSLSSSSEASSQGKHGADEKAQESKGLLVSSEDGITKITFNRPTKRNAITFQVMLLPRDWTHFPLLLFLLLRILALFGCCCCLFCSVEDQSGCLHASFSRVGHCLELVSFQYVLHLPSPEGNGALL